VRQVRDPQLAEEVTQAVFIILARKARAVSRHPTLSGWLCRVAYYVSRDALRAGRRRVHREWIAVQMENTADTDWRHIAPLLDEVVAQLNERDRSAIALRFYEHKSFEEVGNVLGVDADAAQKRVSRALEKLRRFFAKRGVTSAPDIIAGTISAHSVHTAPVALAQSVTAMALAKGGAAGSSTLTLIKGALKLMAWSQAKTAIVVGVGVLVAAGTTTIVVKTAARPSAHPLSTTDLSWADDPKYWEIDFGDPDPQKGSAQDRSLAIEKAFNNLPPVLILRPTRFQTKWGIVSSNDKVLGRGQNLVGLLRYAYDPHLTSKWIVPANVPGEKRFDLMLTLTNRPREALQEEIKRRFGYVAHSEMITTNALLLKVRNPAGPALQPTQGGMPKYPTKSPEHKILIKNQTFLGVADCFMAILKTLVIDRTGIEGRYDIALQWEPKGTETDQEAFKRTVLEELGLEFVPSRETFNYLVVEKSD